MSWFIIEEISRQPYPLYIRTDQPKLNSLTHSYIPTSNCHLRKTMATITFDSLNPVTVAISAGFLLLLIIFVKSRTGSSKRKPPGPPGWPIFGNMFDLGDLPHQTLYKLKSKYGPIVWLQLGSINTMVVQNAVSAAELFKKHDVPFCDRKVPDTLTAFNFNQGSLGMNTYGGHWRVLRRLCSMEFLVNKRMNETTDLRRRIEDNMVRWIEEDSLASKAQGGTGAVQLSRFLFLMAFNLVGNLMLSRDLMDNKDPEGREFFDCMNEILELAGTPNIADFLPLLKKLDPLGMKKRMVDNMSRTMKISSKFVQERLDNRKAGKINEKKDFLDVMLEYQGDGKDGPDKFTEQHVNIVIMVKFYNFPLSTILLRPYRIVKYDPKKTIFTLEKIDLELSNFVYRKCFLQDQRQQVSALNGDSQNFSETHTHSRK